MIITALKNQTNGTITHFGGKLRRLLHGSIFSRVGASTKPGAVQFDELLTTIITAAKGGDMQAMSLLLTRVTPPIKARAMPQAVKLPGDTFKEKLDALTFQLEDEQLTVDEFSAMVTALSNGAKLLESDELRYRIEALEAQLQAKP